MTDIKSPEDRSVNMAHIHSKDTKPEEIVRRYLFSKGFRYRKNQKKLPGTPDIVLPRYRTVVFINGCFWHHHDCKYFVWPKTNSEFWRNKIEGNEQRDLKNKLELENQGWRVITVWECELKKHPVETLENLSAAIRS